MRDPLSWVPVKFKLPLTFVSICLVAFGVGGFVVTSSGLIHDLTTDGKLSGSSDDVRPLSIGPFDFCIRTSATTEWHDGRLEFYALGGPRVVTRFLDDGDLVWEYPGIGTTRMRRICKLPPG